MRRLSDRNYWDSVHRDSATPSPRVSGGRGLLKRLLGPKLLEQSRSYADYFLWRMLAQYLPPTKGLKVLEIGSAPGHFLVEMAERFGYEPFGIEYSETGVAAQRELFRHHGLPENSVIQADFFSDTALDALRGQMDIVISRGFIEHFDEPADVVRRHFKLVRPGGYLVISVPNLRGFNRIMTWITHPSVLKIHNLAIMRRTAFRSLFSPLEIDECCCRYIGTLDFGLFNARPGTPGNLVLRVGRALQRPLNVMLRWLFGSRGLDNSWTSPHLLYIGRKRIS